MFFGAVVKPGETVKLNAEDGEVLHISGACLSNAQSDDRILLILNQNEKNHVLCVLKKDHIENVGLDLFIATRNGGYFKVQGKSEVNVVGYYEPMGDLSELPSDDEDAEMMKIKPSKGSKHKSMSLNTEDDDEDDDDDEIDGEDDDEDDDDDEGDDDDEDKDDDDENDDEDDDEEDDDDDDDENDEEQLRKAIKEQLNKKQSSKHEDKKKKSKNIPTVSATTDLGKKRKAVEQPIFSKPEKQRKNAHNQSSNATQQFEKNITDYLKKHGRSMISQIASACPKPATISSKYREFLVSRPSIFTVEAQMVSLKN